MLFFSLRRLRNSLLSTPAAAGSLPPATDRENGTTGGKNMTPQSGDVIPMPDLRKPVQRYSEDISAFEPDKRHSHG